MSLGRGRVEDVQTAGVTEAVKGAGRRAVVDADELGVGLQSPDLTDHVGATGPVDLEAHEAAVGGEADDVEHALGTGVDGTVDAVLTRRVRPDEITADPDLRTLRNLNTREEYEQALADAGVPSTSAP